MEGKKDKRRGHQNNKMATQEMDSKENKVEKKQ